jgi:hypothetical protein
MCRLAMPLLETAEKVSCDARQPNAPDPPVVARFLAYGESGTDEIIDKSAGGRPRSTDRRRDLTYGRFSAIGHVVHRDELREGQLAPTKLMQGGKKERRREC